jgi:hypothetical protein
MSPQVTSSSTPTQTQQVTVDGNGDRNPAGGVDRHGNRAHQVLSTDTPTRTQRVSSAPAGASESSSTATPEPPSASTPKPAKPAGQPAKPRPVVRDSLGVGQQLLDLPHRGKGDRSSTQAAAVGTEAATGEPSSTASSSAASSSTGSSSGGGSSGGDGDGS